MMMVGAWGEAGRQVGRLRCGWSASMEEWRMLADMHGSTLMPPALIRGSRYRIFMALRVVTHGAVGSSSSCEPSPPCATSVRATVCQDA